MDCSLPDSYVHGVLQARILERVAISLSISLSAFGSREVEGNLNIPSIFRMYFLEVGQQMGTTHPEIARITVFVLEIPTINHRSIPSNI